MHTCHVVQLIDYSGDVVVKRETHEQQESQDADLLPENLCSFRKWAAFQSFDGLIHYLSAIENWNRQQVQHTEADTDQRQEIQKRI